MSNSNWEYFIPVYGKWLLLRDWVNFFFPTNVKMAVLGMDSCGKTTWIKFLNIQKIPERVDHTFEIEDYEKYRVKVAKHRYIEIQKGIDISGNQELVYVKFPSLVKDNEVILFLFNSYKFYNEKDYELEVIDRISIISEYLDKGDKRQKDFFIVPTFKDELLSSGCSCGVFKEFLYKVLRRDESTKLFADPTYVTDIFSTNNKDELKKLKSVVFAKYLK